MARRTFAVGIVALLIVSTFLALGTAGAQAQNNPVGPHAAVHPAISTIQLATTRASDPYYNDTYFVTGNWYGYGYNVLYFDIYDPTTDTQANFTLTDNNASRDGIASPAFHAQVPLTGGYFYGYTKGIGYTFPGTLAIGGTWKVSVSAPLGGNASYNITVGTFVTELTGSPNLYSTTLPGESVTVGWELLSDANGAPDTHVTNVVLYGWYWINNDTTRINLFPGGGMSVGANPLGSYTFTIPANASYGQYIDFDVVPTIQVGGVVAENETSGGYYGVGYIVFGFVHMETEYSGVCPNYYDSYYDSGTLVQVCAVVGAEYNDVFSPVPNLPVTIHFWNGTAVVTPGGSPPTTLTTNATGTIAFSFVPTTPTFSTWYTYPYYNTVNLSATDPSATSFTPVDWETWYNSSFYMYPSASSGGVTVQLNQLEYYPGQTVTASWSISSTDTTTTGTVTAVGWYAWNTQTDSFLGQGTISSTASTGTFTVPLPSGWVGPFGVEVLAANATQSFYGENYAYVSAPRLFLNPDSTSFTPGQTVSINAVAFGDASLTGATITYQVFAGFGLGYGNGDYGLVATGSVSNNTAITIAVPSTGAPSYYYVYAYLTSPGSGIVASASTELSQSWGYFVTVGVTTASNYADGSFQPGQTVTAQYQITPYGNAPLPLVYTFEVYLNGQQIYNVLTSPSSSGSFQVTIPSGIQSGAVFLEVYLQGTYLDGNSCGGGSCYGETVITVNAHPSALSMLVGGNSGITVGWLILLIVILVVAVLLALMIRRKRSPPSSSGGGPSSESMSPPAPAPSGSAPPEWKEPAPAQPPMPNPPA